MPSRLAFIEQLVESMPPYRKNREWNYIEGFLTATLLAEEPAHPGMWLGGIVSGCFDSPREATALTEIVNTVVGYYNALNSDLINEREINNLALDNALTLQLDPLQWWRGFSDGKMRFPPHPSLSETLPSHVLRDDGMSAVRLREKVLKHFRSRR